VSVGLLWMRQDRFQHLFSRLLCTINLRNEPVDTYEAFVAFDLSRIDFLLPDGTWDTLHPGWSPDAADSPYGDWLITVFDYWYLAQPRRGFDCLTRSCS
jgi:uncharacterized protein